MACFMARLFVINHVKILATLVGIERENLIDADVVLFAMV